METADLVTLYDIRAEGSGFSLTADSKMHCDSWSSALAIAKWWLYRRPPLPQKHVAWEAGRSRWRLQMVDNSSRKLSWTYPVGGSVEDRYRGLRAAMNQRDKILKKFGRPVPPPTALTKASYEYVKYDKRRNAYQVQVRGAENSIVHGGMYSDRDSAVAAAESLTLHRKRRRLPYAVEAGASCWSRAKA